MWAISRRAGQKQRVKRADTFNGAGNAFTAIHDLCTFNRQHAHSPHTDTTDEDRWIAKKTLYHMEPFPVYRVARHKIETATPSLGFKSHYAGPDGS